LAFLLILIPHITCVVSSSHIFLMSHEQQSTIYTVYTESTKNNTQYWRLGNHQRILLHTTYKLVQNNWRMLKMWQSIFYKFIIL
jgi:hypothetical protein